MSQKVFCLGPNVYARSLHGGNGFVKLKLRAEKIWPLTPPFVDFIIDSAGSLISAEVSSCVTRFEFDSLNRIEAVPWKTIFSWLQICTLNKSTAFLQSITVAVPKKDLCGSMFKKRKRTQFSFEEVSAGKQTLECGYAKHRSGASGSRTTLIKNIDIDRFEHCGQIVCKSCSGFMAGTGQDGYFHRAQALPLLKHAQSQLDHPFSSVLEMLILLFESTRDTILFFNYFKFYKGADVSRMKEFTFGTPKALFHACVNLQKVITKNQPTEFGCTTKAELKYMASVAANYKIWGRKILSNEKFSQLNTSLDSCMPSILQNEAILQIDNSKFLIAVLSLIESDTEILNVFCDASLAAEAFVQIYYSAEFKLTIPGVDSILMNDAAAYLHEPKNKNVTVVAWPAQFFSTDEILFLSRLTQRVILAGTPYVIGSRINFGQSFTTLFERSANSKFYGIQNQTYASKQFEGLHTDCSQPIPSTVLSISRSMQVYCPVYKLNGKEYFYREIFITLLYHLLKKIQLKYVTVIPGPLFTPTDAELALCSKVPLI